MTGQEDSRCWFYVPNYPGVRGLLESAYVKFGVTKWSAEPTGFLEIDADVQVRGQTEALVAFRRWLQMSRIRGLRIEGAYVL